MSGRSVAFLPAVGVWGRVCPRAWPQAPPPCQVECWSSLGIVRMRQRGASFTAIRAARSQRRPRRSRRESANEARRVVHVRFRWVWRRGAAPAGAATRPAPSSGEAGAWCGPRLSFAQPDDNSRHDEHKVKQRGQDQLCDRGHGAAAEARGWLSGPRRNRATRRAASARGIMLGDGEQDQPGRHRPGACAGVVGSPRSATICVV